MRDEAYRMEHSAYGSARSRAALQQVRRRRGVRLLGQISCERTAALAGHMVDIQVKGVRYHMERTRIPAHIAAVA